jgi:hypothetical protein
MSRSIVAGIAASQYTARWSLIHRPDTTWRRIAEAENSADA